MIQTSSAAHAAVVHRWAFKNYVDIILFIFDHLPTYLPTYLPTSNRSFVTLNPGQKWAFLNHPPTMAIQVVEFSNGGYKIRKILA